AEEPSDVEAVPQSALQAGADAPAAVLDDALALRRGNEAFAAGDLEAALEAYRAGYRPDAPHPTLVYNLATTLHHLDQLPEAILWYRRAAAEDPWVQENLWLARRSLGSQSLGLRGLPSLLVRHSGTLFGVAVGLAWLSLAAALSSRVSRGAWAVALGLTLLAWGGAVAADRFGPVEAVLLTDCAASVGELPAGTELWLWPGGGEELEVVGFTETRCPRSAVAWIEP
ncbi:MAG: tetratricopeptide repeat protein, partial [Acidobacteriota bacterium]